VSRTMSWSRGRRSSSSSSELPRSLKPEQGVDGVYKKICEALGLLTNGFAASVLEKKAQDELVVRCHHGFGNEGPASTVLPFSSSFAALIMSLGQTGYLEDVTLRPELKFPVPKNGAARARCFRRPFGVKEALSASSTYAPSPQSWSEIQVAMIESLAAQAEASIRPRSPRSAAPGATPLRVRVPHRAIRGRGRRRPTGPERFASTRCRGHVQLAREREPGCEHARGVALEDVDPTAATGG
jgi:hypothetical protein